jgi:uncharacterized membrane protein
VSQPEPEERTPLPRRDPRPLVVHIGIAAAVAFLLSVLLFWIVGVPFWVTILFSVGVGVGAGPYLRRAEIEGLARRESSADDS